MCAWMANWNKVLKLISLMWKLSFISTKGIINDFNTTYYIINGK